MADELKEARARMIDKRFGGNAKGASMGDGAARRKKKAPVKTAGDDKKLVSVLKKMGLNSINGVEEVNIFKDDGEVIHITQPKIQASLPSNTFVISGNTESKQLTDLLPGILNQLGPESMDRLRKYAESFGAVPPIEEEDEEVPDLVENFEEAAAK